MNFVGYTYKADVEAEKSMLVNVLKELDSVSDQQFEPNDHANRGGGGDDLDSDQNVDPTYQNKSALGTGSRISTNTSQ